MSTLSMFLKKNKKIKPNVKYAATKSLCDENGNPLEWEIKPISSKVHACIQAESMDDFSVPNKPGQFRSRFNFATYSTRLIAESVVFPDLMSAELQDSYGVNNAEDLVRELVDDAGEWNAFVEFVNELNGLTPIQEDINEAKN